MGEIINLNNNFTRTIINKPWDVCLAAANACHAARSGMETAQ